MTVNTHTLVITDAVNAAHTVQVSFTFVINIE